MKSNTGYKGYGRLRQKNVETGEYTGVTKTNDPSDPDYIAPVYDPTYCEPGELYLEVSRVDIYVGTQSTSVSVDITSNTIWDVAVRSPYLELNFGDEGVNDGTIWVDVLENSSDERTMTFEIKARHDTNLIYIITVHQEGVIQYVPLRLAKGYSHSNACSNAYPDSVYMKTYYAEVDDFYIATKLMKDSSGTQLANAGYYSDGEVTRYWDGSKFTGRTNACMSGTKFS
jgi:hypothetical protein